MNKYILCVCIVVFLMGMWCILTKLFRNKKVFTQELRNKVDGAICCLLTFMTVLFPYKFLESVMPTDSVIFWLVLFSVSFCLSFWCIMLVIKIYNALEKRGLV